MSEDKPLGGHSTRRIPMEKRKTNGTVDFHYFQTHNTDAYRKEWERIYGKKEVGANVKNNK